MLRFKVGVWRDMLDVVPMVPHVPGHIKEFLDEFYGPPQPILLALLLRVMVVLDGSNAARDLAHHKVVPSNSSLGVEGLSDFGWKIVCCWGVVPTTQLADKGSMEFIISIGLVKPIVQFLHCLIPRSPCTRGGAAEDVLYCFLCLGASWATRVAPITSDLHHSSDSAMASVVFGEPASLACGDALQGPL